MTKLLPLLAVYALINVSACTGGDLERVRAKNAKLKREIVMHLQRVSDLEMALRKQEKAVVRLRQDIESGDRELKLSRQKIKEQVEAIAVLSAELKAHSQSGGGDGGDLKGDLDRAIAARDRCEEKATKMRTALFDARAKLKTCEG